MKKLMKASILAICLFFAFTANAQIRFGVKGGINASSLADYSKNSEYIAGFHAGVIGQINFPSSNFFLQPEFLYSMQGTKIKKHFVYENYTEKHTDNQRNHYLQIPVYLGYKIDAGLGLNIIVAAGPYLAYGVAGDNDFFEEAWEDTTGQGFLKFDLGFTAMAGVQFNKFQITAGYDLGVLKLNDSEFYQNSHIYNRNAKVSLGYFF